MEVIHIAAELAPVAKVGGLGDMVFGLARAQMAQGLKPTVILPKYQQLPLDQIEDLQCVEKGLPSLFAGERVLTKVWQGRVSGVAVLLIDPELDFFKRGSIYGFPDDPERFCFFSKVALEFIVDRGMEPKVVHLHDWHVSLCAPLLRDVFNLSAKVVLTIHNLGYQGKAPVEVLEKVDYTSHAFLDDYHPKEVNLLKGGILFSDAVTTVSPTYAKEIMQNDDLIVDAFHTPPQGIINGIDYEYWNPETDPALPEHFSPRDLRGKQALQETLRKQYRMNLKKAPLFAVISRLVAQKGPELICEAISAAVKKGGQFFLIGSASDPETEKTFATLKKRLEGTNDVRLELTYNEKLSHLLYAAADFIVIPSIFEPCGLTQLIAMRYGTVPIVRKTGGLADTVKDGVNGFTFTSPTPVAVQEAIDRASLCWNNDSEQFKKLQTKGLKEDFSWGKSAEKYKSLYERTKAEGRRKASLG